MRRKINYVFNIHNYIEPENCQMKHPMCFLSQKINLQYNYDKNQFIQNSVVKKSFFPHRTTQTPH